MLIMLIFILSVAAVVFILEGGPITFVLGIVSALTVVLLVWTTDWRTQGEVLDWRSSGAYSSSYEVPGDPVVVGDKEVATTLTVTDEQPAVHEVLLYTNEDRLVWVEVPFEVLTELTVGDYYIEQ